MSQTEVQLIKSSSVVDGDIVGMSSSKLSGALPAVSAANLTNIPAANLTGALPAISGANLTNIDGGKILKVHSVSSTTGQEITSSSYVDLTNMSITLTPAATSKCYVFAVINGYTEFPSTFHGTNTLQLLRDSTEIATAIRGIRLDNSMSINFLQNQSSLSIAILDTHGANGSTAITYKLRGKTSSGKMYTNSNFGTQSNFSVYEVAPN
tara:strand:- start:473 stop:1099 length:627 start_codon:yes stop_codon:yes gene_type:complete